jgi:cysteine desulfurase / selenocysteine lyase
MPLDIEQIRRDFPILGTSVHGKPLVYLDNAATSQKPQRVLDAIQNYYASYNSNIHRGAHHLAHLATEAYESSRNYIAQTLNASPREINFVRGTTEAINLVANTYGRKYVQAGDEIIISEMEHHSNIVPWQMLCAQQGAILKVIPVTDSGELILEEYYKLLSHKTRLVSITYVSNALGTINPIRDIIKAAHDIGAVVMIDAAQALPHMRVDVQELDADFMAFSGHKVCAPTGIGILYGKEAHLLDMPPYMGGGEMIDTVSFAGTTYNDLPYKFEAGTPHIEGGIVLGEAMRYMADIGMDNIAAHEQQLLDYATTQLSAIDGLKIIGTAAHKSSVVSFLIEGLHPYDIGVLLDARGIAIRTGHHCCQPLMQRYGIEGTCRASFAFYNTLAEIDMLVAGLHNAIELLG